jgi:hypothetical protein
MKKTSPDLQTSSGQVMSYDEDLCAGENLSSVSSQPGGLQELPTVSHVEYVQTPFVYVNMKKIRVLNRFLYYFTFLSSRFP